MQIVDGDSARVANAIEYTIYFMQARSLRRSNGGAASFSDHHPDTENIEGICANYEQHYSSACREYFSRWHHQLRQRRPNTLQGSCDQKTLSGKTVSVFCPTTPGPGSTTEYTCSFRHLFSLMINRDKRCRRTGVKAEFFVDPSRNAPIKTTVEGQGEGTDWD